MFLVASVAEVEPGHIHACLHQLFDLGEGLNGGTDGANYFGTLLHALGIK